MQKLNNHKYHRQCLKKMADEPIPSTLIRASVQGTVYLIDSPTGRVYTYNPENPTYIGTLEKIPDDERHLISKTNGCLASARVKFRPDIKEVMAILRNASATVSPSVSIGAA